MIIEVLGRPEKHLIDTLEDMIKQIGAETGIKITQSKVMEPHSVKDQKDLFTSFAEVEIESEGIMPLIGITFKYMPSHIEIIEPEKIILKNHEAGDLLSEMTRRLHRYEELVRVMQIQMQNSQAHIEPALEELKKKLQGKEEDKKDRQKDPGAKTHKKD